MRIDKLLLVVPMAFSMLFSSGVTSANELPYEKVYKCWSTSQQASYLKGLQKDDDSTSIKKSHILIHFMKDGGFMFATLERGVIAETYGPVTQQETLLNKDASTLRAFYNDLGLSHQFVLAGGKHSRKGFTTTLTLDKDVMIGTAHKRSTLMDGTEKTRKQGYLCTKVYPSV